MNFYYNLKVRDKLALGYAVVLLCCFLVGFLGFKGMSEAQNRLNNVQQHMIPSIKTVAKIDNTIEQYRRVYLRYMLAISPQQRKELEAKLTADELAITDLLERSKAFHTIPKERELLDNLSVIIQEFYVATKKMRSAISSGIKYEALQAEHLRIKKISDQLESTLTQLSQFNDNEVKEHFEQSNLSYSEFRFWLAALIIFSIILAISMLVLISRSIANPLRQVLEAVRSQQAGGEEKVRLAEAIAGGDLNQEVIITEPFKIDNNLKSRDETGMLLKAFVGMSEVQQSLDLAFADMTSALRQNRDQKAVHDWFKSGQNDLNTILRGDKPTAKLANQALAFLAGYLGAGVGVFYVFDEKEAVLQMAASYALAPGKHLNERIALGEGLAGQAALEKKVITLQEAPPDYLSISSGLGESRPAHIVALPLLHNNTLVGLLELGSFTTFSDNDLSFLQQIMEALAITLSVNKSHQKLNDLLEHTQGQSEELQMQQEELQQTNEELEERAQLLEQQREQIRVKNRALEETWGELQLKANELERVSTYKSEFLANMSHELRTPLNSLMILSSLLKDNREGNLTAKQVEFAATINGAGRDLLNLINDILDLSKIESGHMEFHYEDLNLSEICEQIETVFNPIAGDRGIDFTVTVDDSSPKAFTADSQRTQQILKNLLSNACKFTSEGAVILRVYTPEPGECQLETPSIAFAVSDTGIGIPTDKQSLIFNAFQQADGSTSRTYGGTGLGLSISRQLARSMGGEISLTSEEGKGSTFTLYLPIMGICDLNAAAEKPDLPASPVKTAAAGTKSKWTDTLPAPLPDDRLQIPEGGKSILVIEDDLTFAGILLRMVRDRGFSALVAADGENGIAMAELYRPSAIILDVMLPHIDGWGVMRSLKDNPATRHIPVHFVTCLEERQKAMSMGAIGYVTKPVSRELLDNVFSTLESTIKKTMKMLLIVEDDPAQAQAMVALLEEREVAILVAESGAKAIELLSRSQFDCIVLDLGLSDMSAFELLEELKKLDPERRIPVIIHTGRELTQEDEKRLHHYAESIIIKGAKSPERLLNEVTLFLHLVETSLPPDKQRMIRTALDKEAMLAEKKVLIVDDDMRNIFSLSSALSEKDIIIFEADNGREALNRLNEFPDIDLVLMDIMMPEMDGYEAMRAIRKDPRFVSLPIIALTAKAMKGDREECLKAGASDYIPKPVDMEKLFSLLRVWLYQDGCPQ
ncbi:MAG: response regulator [Geobacteraceae bacterium]|nr:response regulator [Geobacteraceae bacterium]NTW78694.1 response regulator [Geobacteraceae bacterium]